MTTGRYERTFIDVLPIWVLALALIVGCSAPANVVPSPIGGEGAIIIAALDRSAGGELVFRSITTHLAADPVEISVAPEGAFIAVTLLPAADFVHASGDKVSPTELAGLRARDRDAPPAPGFGACERCLAPRGSGPSVVFPGDSCAPTQRPTLFDRDGIELGDGELIELARARVRLDWPGACETQPRKAEAARVLSACPLWPESPDLESITLAASGLVIGAFFDRVTAVEPDGHREELSFQSSEHDPRLALLTDTASSATFAMVVSGDDGSELRLFSWDRTRPVGRRLRPLLDEPMPFDFEVFVITEKEVGRFIALGRIEDAPAASECVFTGASVTCRAAPIDARLCRGQSTLVAVSRGSTRTAALDSRGDAYLASDSTLSCAGSMVPPGEDLDDVTHIAIVGSTLVACILLVTRDAVVVPAIVRAHLDESDPPRIIGDPQIVATSARCVSLVPSGERARAFLTDERVMDVSADRIETSSRGGPGYPFPAAVDRPARDQHARGDRELIVGVDGALFSRRAPGQFALTLGHPRYAPFAVRALAETRDGTMIAVHDDEGVLRMTPPRDGCPGMRAAGIRPSRGATAAAVDSRGAQRVAVATSSAGLRRLQIVDLEDGSVQDFVAPSPGAGLRALVEIAAGKFVGITAEGVPVEITREGYLPIAMTFDDPRTVSVEGAPGAVDWNLAAGTPGVAWLGGKAALGRVVPTARGLLLEGYWLERAIRASLDPTTGRDVVLEVQALAAFGPDELQVAAEKTDRLSRRDALYHVFAADQELRSTALLDVASRGPIAGLAGPDGTVLVREMGVVGLDHRSTRGIGGPMAVGPPGRFTIVSTRHGRLTALVTGP